MNKVFDEMKNELRQFIFTGWLMSFIIEERL